MSCSSRGTCVSDAKAGVSVRQRSVCERWQDWGARSGGQPQVTPRVLGALYWARASEAVDDGTGAAASVVPLVDSLGLGSMVPTGLTHAHISPLGAGKQLAFTSVGATNNLQITGAVLPARPCTVVSIFAMGASNSNVASAAFTASFLRQLVDGVGNTLGLFDGIAGDITADANVAVMGMRAAIFDAGGVGTVTDSVGALSASGSVPAVATGVCLNMRVPGANSLNCAWAEVSTYGRALTGSELAVLYATYAKPFYGLTP